MVCLAPRALGESVRPRRLAEVVARPLNLTVRRRLGHPVPPLSPFACVFVAMHRIFGAFMLLSGTWLIGACAWCLLGDATHWPQWYPGGILIAVGTL